MKLTFIFLAIVSNGCSHMPKCGNPEGARVVLFEKNSCKVRIRQVTVGSDLKIPQSLKDSGLSQFSLDWVEPGMTDGQIVLGYFVLIPTSNRQENK